MVLRQFAFAAIFFFPVILCAQDTVVTLVPQRDTTAKEAPHHVMVGSEDEDYLRYLQDAGIAALYPWSLREFSQKELATMAVKPGSHPWSGKGDYKDYPSRYSFKILPVNVEFRFNSAFPYGSNDGAVWAGRGLTSAIDLGFAFRAGPLSVTINPIGFRAENLRFPLEPAGGPNPYADPQFPTQVDRPQRFGPNAYTRADPGESTARLDLLGLTVGMSTANMGWGPMEIYPYIIGGNAPGFPHLFAGTSSPLPILVGRLHARLYWGRLDQSAYSPVGGPSYYSSILEGGTKRFMSGAVAMLEPRGVPGLELGVARFFQSVWPRTGIPRSFLTKPFQSLLKNSLGNVGGFVGGTDPGIEDNQLASAFGRWVFPASRFEVYGEYGREDHNANFRDLIQEPDHSRTYGLGLRKVFAQDSLQLSAIRLELINYELPTLARHREEGGIYLHGVLRQGHTNRGQVLGADAGLGTGAGFFLAWDKYDRSGKYSIGWTRTIRKQDGDYYLLGGRSNPRANDVSYALNAERLKYMSFGHIQYGFALLREFNRDFQHDAWNVNTTLGFNHSF
jgi:hypothetical protein